jgi:hypothetical protein
MEITLDVYIGADTNDDPSEATVYDVKIVDEKAFKEWLDADMKDTPKKTRRLLQGMHAVEQRNESARMPT